MNEEDSRKHRADLVAHLRANRYIRSELVEEAFMTIKRESFLPPLLRRQAYMDRPLPIGKGQTISAPHMIAIMEEELLLERGMKVLEIGGGSGYHAAITAHIIGPEGSVVSVERIPALVRSARRSLQEAGIINVDMVEADGSSGFPEGGSFDRIYYTCAAPYLPDSVKDQLKEGGIILSVEGPAHSVQRLIRYRKTETGSFEKEILTSCVFVPLIGKEGHSH